MIKLTEIRDCRKQAEKAVSTLDKECWLKVAEERLKLALSADGNGGRPLQVLTASNDLNARN
jgi:hypothetical protein